jgi:hypothetical protein
VHFAASASQQAVTIVSGSDDSGRQHRHEPAVPLLPIQHAPPIRRQPPRVGDAQQHGVFTSSQVTFELLS